MKITTQGFIESQGSSVIANQDVEFNENKNFKVKWHNSAAILNIPLEGVERDRRSIYHIIMTADELALLVDRMLSGCSEEKAMQAQAKAIAAFIREAGTTANKDE